jgi:hypothetical protein
MSVGFVDDKRSDGFALPAGLPVRTALKVVRRPETAPAELPASGLPADAIRSISPSVPVDCEQSSRVASSREERASRDRLIRSGQLKS